MLRCDICNWQCCSDKKPKKSKKRTLFIKVEHYPTLVKNLKYLLDTSKGNFFEEIRCLSLEFSGYEYRITKEEDGKDFDEI